VLTAGPLRPIRYDDDRAQRGALLIARIATAVYLLEVLLNLLRPRLLEHEPVLTIFQKVDGTTALARLLNLPEAIFWLLLLGIVAGVVLQIVAVRYPPKSRTATALLWATLAAMLGPFAIQPLMLIAISPLAALACVPTTLLVLWLLHEIQVFLRVPVSMLLAAFAWGALISFGFARACSGLALGTVYGFIGQGQITAGEGEPIAALSSFTDGLFQTMSVLTVHLVVLAQAIQAAGILLVLLVFRHRITDLTTGLIIGAAAGVGYNFTESVIYIHLFGGLLSPVTGATSAFEYWIRQCVTLLGGHLAFGALIGAGLGLAAQLPEPRRRALVAGAGLLAAIGASLANEIVTAWISHLLSDHVHRGSVLDTLIVSPLIVLFVQAPFIVLYLLLLRAGLRDRLAAALEAVPAEAASGLAAITPVEVPILVSPTLRFWALVSTARERGFATARALYRLQAAQLELAGWRWQQLKGSPLDDPIIRAEGEELHLKVMRLKQPPPKAAPQAATS
jgi:hypothetical protein